MPDECWGASAHGPHAIFDKKRMGGKESAHDCNTLALFYRTHELLIRGCCAAVARLIRSCCAAVATWNIRRRTRQTRRACRYLPCASCLLSPA